METLGWYEEHGQYEAKMREMRREELASGWAEDGSVARAVELLDAGICPCAYCNHE